MKNGLDVRLGRKRDESVPSAFGYVSLFVEVVGRKGDVLDTGVWFGVCLCF